MKVQNIAQHNCNLNASAKLQLVLIHHQPSAADGWVNQESSVQQPAGFFQEKQIKKPQCGFCRNETPLETLALSISTEEQSR